MTKLEKLIEELCPGGVEYRKLKEVCDNIIVPMRDRPKVFDGDIPWCRIEDKEGQFFNGSKSGLAVSKEIVKKMNLKVFPTGTVICSCSASIGSYAINTQPLITNQTFIGLVCGKEINNKFLLYFMETQTKTLLKKATTGTIPYISRNKFEELLVPVPPLEIQSEIVRILDNFTELTAELNERLDAELTARKKQYEYYRDELFNGIQNYPKHVLNSLADIKRGVRVVKKDLLPDGEYPVYQNSLAPMGYYNSFNCESGTTYVISAGAAGEIGYCNSKFWAADDCLVFSNLNGVINRYIYHYLMTKSTYIKSNVRKASIPRLSRTVIEKIEIPVPPINEQERIVNILDRFDALCNDITQGLPAEIEARQKQYEYYRDKLLTFKEIEDVNKEI